MTAKICFITDEPRSSMVERRIQPIEWASLARVFNVEAIIEIDPWSFYPVEGNSTRVVTLAEGLALAPESTWVFVDNQHDGAVLLEDYTHLDDAVYCFGSDSNGFGDIDPGAVQFLEIVTHDSESLYAIQAAAIVLNHRYVQRDDS